MPVTSLFSEHINFLKREIDNALKKIPTDKEPKYLYEPIAYAIRGKAKRLRPVFVHLAGNVFQGDPEQLMKAALAVELLHNFSLVHDDIMDNDNMRHGQLAIHNKWDNSAAILSGDGLFVLSQLSISYLNPIIQLRFNEVALLVCEGQGLDKEFEGDLSVTMDQYIDMISKKTGALLGLCGQLGGLIGGLSIKSSEKLFKFGLNLGLAFQVQDDYLEVFGNEALMGKTLGSDIEAGKQTAMTILARKKNSKDWLSFFKKNHSIASYREYFDKNGIRKETEEKIKHYINKANKKLEFIDEKKRKDLQKFAKLILNRKY